MRRLPTHPHEQASPYYARPVFCYRFKTGKATIKRSAAPKSPSSTARRVMEGLYLSGEFGAELGTEEVHEQDRGDDAHHNHPDLRPVAPEALNLEQCPDTARAD